MIKKSLLKLVGKYKAFKKKKTLYTAIFVSIITSFCTLLLTLLILWLARDYIAIQILPKPISQITYIETAPGETMSISEKVNEKEPEVVKNVAEIVKENKKKVVSISVIQNSTGKKIRGGSGFFVASNGLIATNRHVVSDVDVVFKVITNSGKEYDATVLATDPFNDIAFVKIQGSGFPYFEFGDSNELQPGETVIAIGNALAEFQNSVSVGVVSGLGRSVYASTSGGKNEFLENLIQTDAAINPGNSGGPLINIQGLVIGMNVATATRSENIGFALHGNLIKRVLEQVKNSGEIARPYIGIRYVAVTPLYIEKTGIPVTNGVVVSPGANGDPAVLPNSPGAKAGIVSGDIVVSLDGIQITETRTLTSLMQNKRVGQQVILGVYRNGQTITIPVTLEKNP
jgi:S1-C subfamily serine protease